METSRIKLSSQFALTAYLSGGITIALSLIYTLLSIAALIFRNNCSYGVVTNANGAEYFWKTIFSAYILSKDCPASQTALDLVDNEITGEYTMYVFSSLTLSGALVCVVAASILITVVQDEGSTRFITYVVFCYIGCCIASLVVDLTVASHFGIDLTYLSSLLQDLPAGAESNYKIEVLRQGAFFMMTIAMKGYVAPAVNLLLMIILAVYVLEHRRLVNNSQHSIHTLGVLTAFDKPRKTDDWTSSLEPPLTRGSHMNNAFLPDISPPPRHEPPRNGFNNPNAQLNPNVFVNDDSPPRTPQRNNSRNGHNNLDPAFINSDSWHHTRLTPNNYGSRPFSYLEDIRNSGANRPPPPSPAVEEPWRRDPWPPIPGPPVPPPDYSPVSGKRLKSVLKPVYM